MIERDLYRTILGVEPPWHVVSVDIDKRPWHPESPDPFQHWKGKITVRVDRDQESPLCCPQCQKPCPGYDHRTRTWRHLDTCQFHTVVVCEVPRIQCQEHGVHQVSVPWAESSSRFPALFEAFAITWLKEASFAAVARLLHLSWDQVDGIVGRAVKRGLARRTKSSMRRIAVDETSFQKRHEYVTVVTNQDWNRVEYIADGHGKASLDGFWSTLEPDDLRKIESVSMDMWRPYMRSTREFVPDAESKICFDKFHVAKHLGEAVDRVRRSENADLWQTGDGRLKGSRFLWLKNPSTMSDKSWDRFESLRESKLKTSRAWHLKEVAMGLWSFLRRGWGRKAWMKWIGWAMRSRLEPMRQAAKMIKNHLEGILNAIVMRVNNAGAESINAKIQKIKRQACGFRNRDRFRNAIYFHCGGLDLCPILGTTHTKS